MRYAVVDLSNAIALAELEAYAAAQQTQLREHYAAVYDGDGIEDEVRVAGPVGSATAVQPGEVVIVLHPNADGAPEGALAVHGIAPDGTPTCDVYLDLVAKYGDEWTATASHEVLEARADPRLHACVELDDGSIWDREICDRVEAMSYPVNGVPLSNFNTPGCFEPSGVAGEGFDWLGASTVPNQILEGGYAQRFDLATGWTQVGMMRGYRKELARRGLSRGSKRRLRGHRKHVFAVRAFDPIDDTCAICDCTESHTIHNVGA